MAHRKSFPRDELAANAEPFMRFCPRILLRMHRTKNTWRTNKTKDSPKNECNEMVMAQPSRCETAVAYSRPLLVSAPSLRNEGS